MILTYQFKLLPTRAQHGALEACLERQRLLYNAALHQRRIAWYLEQRRAEVMDQWRALGHATGSSAAALNAMAFWTLSRVEQTFRRVYAGDSGLPRFKPALRWASFGFSGWRGIDLKTTGEGKARLSILGLPGTIRVHLHRPLPEGAAPKAAVLTRGVKGWTLSVQLEIADHPVVHPQAESLVGIDAGVSCLAMVSDGTAIENPRIGRATAAELRIANRKISRRKKGSRRREKAIMQLRRLMRRVENSRRTNAHQVSSKIAASHGVIVVEKLDIKRMTRSAKGTVAAPGKGVRRKAGLNKSIMDASLGRLRHFLVYKAARAGGRVIEVDPRGTSIQCSSCGTRVPKILRERTHRCTCGCVLDRDLNAAINIKKAAEAVVRLGSVNAGRTAA